MIIPGYDILEKLGEGGTASVWKARQLSLNRLVAIKLLTEQKLQNPEMITRFRMEAESTARLNHPGIVHIHDMGEHEQFAYLVMEFVDGRSLDQVLAEEKRLPPDQVLDLAQQVAKAMDYAWDSARLVHCDLKPGNILIDDQGRIKISDLGVSRLLGRASEDVDQDMITGTPYYASPEQIDAVPLDARSDIYSLGATLYHALTGQMPFGDDDAETVLHKQGREQIPDPLDVDRSLPANLVWLLDKMMKVDQRDRPKDWRELLDDIGQVQKGHPPTRISDISGVSTIHQSSTRPQPKAKEIRVKKAPGVTAVKAPAKGKPLAPPSMSPGRSQRKGEFLRPAVSQLLTVGILTGCVYGLLIYFSSNKEELAPPVVESEESGIRKATADEKSRLGGTKAPEREPVQDARPSVAPEPGPSGAQWDHPEFQQALKKINASRAEYKRFAKDQDQARLDKVERLAREGLDVLEQLQKQAPKSANVGEEIRKGYQSISNARQSRKLNLDDVKISSRPPAAPPPPSRDRASPEAGLGIKELFERSPTPPPAARREAPSTPTELAPEFTPFALTFAESWNPDQDYEAGVVQDVVRVLQPYGRSSAELGASSEMRFPGDIPYRMPIKMAGERLSASMSGRAPLRNPALPVRSLIGYRFNRNFGDGFDTCILVVDLKGQVVAAQIQRSQPPIVPSLPRNLYSDRWSTADLLMGTPPKQSDWKVAHRVRRVKGGVVVESEAATPQRLEPRSSSRLFLPSPMVNVLLHRNLPPEE